MEDPPSIADIFNIIHLDSSEKQASVSMLQVFYKLCDSMYFQLQALKMQLSLKLCTLDL